MRPGSFAWRVILVALAIGLPIAVWDRRGAVVGAIAFAVYTPIFLGGAFFPDRVTGWSRRHVALDAAIMAPLTFLGLAYLTGLALWICALAGVAAGALFVPIALRRRGAPRSPSR